MVSKAHSALLDGFRDTAQTPEGQAALKIALYQRDFRRLAGEQLYVQEKPPSTRLVKMIPLFPSQEIFLRVMEEQEREMGFIRCVLQKARQQGGCLDPETRVLTADLRWVPIQSVNPGDLLLSTDEMPIGGKGPAENCA